MVKFRGNLLWRWFRGNLLGRWLNTGVIYWGGGQIQGYFTRGVVKFRDILLRRWSNSGIFYWGGCYVCSKFIFKTPHGNNLIMDNVLLT